MIGLIDRMYKKLSNIRKLLKIIWSLCGWFSKEFLVGTLKFGNSSISNGTLQQLAVGTDKSILSFSAKTKQQMKIMKISLFA